MKTPWNFTDADLPSMASHCNQNQCGFCLYRGVLVRWDEDQDERVFELLDDMPAIVLDQLLVVQEHEASIIFVWSGTTPPKGYEEGGGIDIASGDHWTIHESYVASKLPRITW